MSGARSVVQASRPLTLKRALATRAPDRGWEWLLKLRVARRTKYSVGETVATPSVNLRSPRKWKLQSSPRKKVNCLKVTLSLRS